MHKHSFFILLFLVSVSFFARIFYLGGVPPGLSNDEADIGYDAYSLLLTGKDQWGVKFPITFKGFGDYRLPVYTYAVVPFVKIFGLNATAVRLPSAISAIGIILATFFLGKILFGKRAGLFAAFFAAFAPWVFGMTRVGIESPMATALFLFGLILFLRSEKSPALEDGSTPA